MKLNPSVFREYDIRGIAGRDLDPEFAEQLGRAYAEFTRGRKPEEGRPRLKVSVGRDCRLTSDAFADALCKGLRKGGIDTVDLGVCPTPLTYFSVYHLKLDGGIMVTGSHKPSDYNGFKIGVGKGTLHGSQIQELRAIMEAARYQDQSGAEHSQYEIIPAYVEEIAKGFKPIPKKKIVMDAGNGTAATVAPLLLEKLGAEVIPLYCELDGTFPNHHPDPTVGKNLKDLIASVKQNKADFGVAFDGDADRIGAVDENGRIIFGDELMVILSRAVLKENPGATIISEVKSSHRLYQDIAAKGGKPLMWKTGHSLIKSKLRETGGALAGEMSGHVFFNDRYFGYDDAVYTAARLYEIVGHASTPVSDFLKDLTPVVATPEIRVDCEEEKKFALVEETKKRLPSDLKVVDIDGVRVEFDDGWGLARASNTQPVLVLRFEAVNQNRLSEMKDLFLGTLNDAARSIGHSELKIIDES